MSEIRTHHFESTAQAYDRTQTDEGIADGDVLIIESEGVVGILDLAWPVAVTELRGEFHTWKYPATQIRFGTLIENVRLAVRLASERDFPVSDLHKNI